MLRVGSKTDGSRTMRGAHVITWENHNKQMVPKGMVVRHTCDNPPCCNPEHLSLGTQGDNVRECHAKGRARPGVSKGEANGQSKLTEQDVIKIRAEFRQGAAKTALARKYSVSDTLIRKVVNKSAWSHVGG